MEKLTFSNLTLSNLKPWVNLQEYGIADYEWLRIDEITLTIEEEQQLRFLKSRLQQSRMLLMNEATIWARGIYPLLFLAERDSIQAWSGVTLKTTYSQFELEGIVDGILGKCVSGVIESPFLIVVEAKRGLESVNPVYQLYGQLLAASHLNWENDSKEVQEIYGCYTVADIWTFIRAEVTGMTSDKPTLRIESSKEYPEQTESVTILKILKSIVAKFLKIP